MSSTYRVEVQVIADKAKQGIDKLKTGFDGLKNSTTKAGKTLDELNHKSAIVGKSFGLLKTAIGALGLGLGVGAILQTADKMQVLNSQIKIATDTAERYGIAMQNVERIAMSNRVSLEAVGTLYVSNERALKQLGKSQQEVLKFTENVTTAMQVGGGSAEAQAAAITQLGQAMASGVLRGDEFNSIAEQAPMIMELMSDSLKVTTGELRDMAADGEITAEAVYKAISSAEASQKLQKLQSNTAITMGGAMQNLRTQWELAVNELMNGQGGLSQAIASVIDKVAQAIPKIKEFIYSFGETQAFALLKSAMDMVVGGFDRLKTFFSEHPILAENLATALGVLAGTFVAFSVAMGAAAAATSIFAGAFALFTNPILIIGALIAAGVLLYQNWDLIKQKAQEVFNSLPQPIKTAFDDIKSVWQDLVDIFSVGFEVLVPIAKAQFGVLKFVVTTVFDTIKGFLTTWFNAAKAVFIAGVSVFATIFKTNFELIKTVISTVFNVIKALLRGDMEGVKTAISTGIGKAAETVKTGVNKILTAFSNLTGQLIQIGKDAIQGLIDGIASKFQAVTAKVAEIAGLIPAGVRKLLDIHSPSRVMKRLGNHTAEGLAVGIKQGSQKAAQAAQKMADDVKKAVADSVANLKREIALFGDDSPISALNYDIKAGKYNGANTSELQALTAQKYALERNQAVLDDIAKINQEIATLGLDNLQLLTWEIEHTNKYKDVSSDVLAQLKAKTAEQMAFNQALEQQNKIAAANDRSQNSFNSLQKQLALFGNSSKLAEFDYDWQNGAFAGADNMLLLRERNAIFELENRQRQSDTKSAFDNLTKGLATDNPMAKLQADYNERLRIISEFETAHTGVEEQAQAARMQAEQAYITAKNNLMLDGYGGVFSSISGLTKSFFGEQSGIYRAMFAMEKGFAIAKAIIALKANIAEASKLGFPQNIPMIAGAVSQGMGIISDIRAIAMPIGQAHDGIMSVPKSGTWNLEKGERVLPQHTAKNLDNTLNRLQGGQVINVNVVVNRDDGTVQSSQAMGQNLGNAIKAAVQAELQKERKQGGLLYGR